MEGLQSTGSVPGTGSLQSLCNTRSLQPVGKSTSISTAFVVMMKLADHQEQCGRDGAGLNKNQMCPRGPSARLCWGIPHTHPQGVGCEGPHGASPGFPPVPARSTDTVGISSHVCIENLKLWGFISSGVGDRKGKSNENLLKTENNKFLIFSPSSPTPWSI